MIYKYKQIYIIINPHHLQLQQNPWEPEGRCFQVPIPSRRQQRLHALHDLDATFSATAMGDQDEIGGKCKKNRGVRFSNEQRCGENVALICFNHV